MVEPDTFLTALYVTVDEIVQEIMSSRPVPPGPAPALSVSEVVTLALYGQWQHFGGERAFYRHAERCLRAAFPRLPHRSQYNRLLRRYHGALAAVGQHLARVADALRCAYEALDSLGIVTRNVKRRGHGWLDGQAAKGWCTRLGFFHGLHLVPAVTPRGAITGWGLSPTTVSDQARAETFLALRHRPHPALPEVGTSACGVYVTDTGFEGAAWWQRWASLYHAQVIAPPKIRQTRTRCWSRALRRAHAGWRQISETVHHCLLQTFGLERERPHTMAGLRARVAAKVGLHNFCLWLNLQLGRPPLAFADLVDW